MKAEISSETLVSVSQSTFIYSHKILFFRFTDVRTSEFTTRLSVYHISDYETANLIHMYFGHQHIGNLKKNTPNISSPQQQVYAITFLA
jgi:hypothetical protein